MIKVFLYSFSLLYMSHSENNKTDIHQYVKSLFLNAPIEQDDSAIFRYFITDSRFKHISDTGRYTLVDHAGIRHGSRYERFAFKNHPVIGNEIDSAEILFTFSRVNSQDKCTSVSLEFNFADNEIAKQLYNKLFAGFKNAGAVFSVDIDDDDYEENSGSYTIGSKIISISLIRGQFTREHRPGYYTEIKLRF